MVHMTASHATEAHPTTHHLPSTGKRPSKHIYERMRGGLRLTAWLAIAASVIVLFRALPAGRVLELVQSEVATLGALAPLVFGAAYFAAALLFVPGSALTLAAGAIFGLAVGTATVSVASTLAAGASFLIARYVAREKVKTVAETNRTFGAIDRAIAHGGWRIIALLRLSPAVPFSLGNYLYGLTPVKFWPYLLASWIAMMPGTFLYVYLGHVGGSAASGGQEKNPWQTVLLIAGLVATVAVTVYITRLARKALHESALQETESAPPSAKVRGDKEPRPVGRLLTTAVVLIAVAACAQANRTRLSSLFGPPKAKLAEAYRDVADGVTFDHSALDALLHAKVHEDGYVDYKGLATQQAALNAYIATLATADVESLGRDERLAFLINAYNAFTLRLILDYYPLASIKDIPAEKRWDAVRWDIAGTKYSLNQIEHELIRPKFAEPRIHFALVCAAIGCPPLRPEAYSGARLEEQLTDQAKYVNSHDRWIQIHTGRNEVELTSLYKWYAGDFEQTDGSVINFAAKYSPGLAALVSDGKQPRVTYLEYDWGLNELKVGR